MYRLMYKDAAINMCADRDERLTTTFGVFHMDVKTALCLITYLIQP